MSLLAYLVNVSYHGPLLNQIDRALSVCLPTVLSISHLLSMSLFRSLFLECGAIPLVSCRERNLKGSGINKRKASQTKLQRGFGRHAGSGAVCAHKELSVRAVVLRIPVEHSLSYTLSHALQSHTYKQFTELNLTECIIFNLVVHKLSFHWVIP